MEGCSIQNPYNIQADNGLRRIFRTSSPPHGCIRSPFGRGQKLTSGNKVVDTLIGSWNLNGIVSFGSGALFDVGTGKDLAGTGN